MSETKETKVEVPCATTSIQSSVIDMSLDDVWNTIKYGKFDWYHAVDAKAPTCSVPLCTDIKEHNPLYKPLHLVVGSTREIKYPDGVLQGIMITGISDKDHTLSWKIVTSEPAIGYTSREDTIKLYKVTDFQQSEAGAPKAQTFIHWSSDFSSDVTNSVILDCDYKKRDAFKFFWAQAAKASAGGSATGS